MQVTVRISKELFPAILIYSRVNGAKYIHTSMNGAPTVNDWIVVSLGIKYPF